MARATTAAVRARIIAVSLFALPPSACGDGGAAVETADSSSTSTTTDSGAQTCDMLEQDCAEGAKCLPTQITHNPAIIEDHVDAWCSPLASDLVGFGETCEVDVAAYRDPTTSYDNCGADLVCWGVDDDHRGRCERMCVHTDDGPGCTADAFCAVGFGLYGVICVEPCDPLAAECPFATDACFLLEDTWGCYPRDAHSLGTLKWPCSFSNDCAAGWACLDEDEYAGCSDSHGFGGCCAKTCDLADAGADDDCAIEDPARRCQPWAEGAAASSESLGVCIP